MAVDPNLPDEQKKRLQRPDSSLPWGITGATAVQYRPSPSPSPQEEGYRPTDRQRTLARAGVLAAEAENARGAFVDAEERAIDARQRALHDRGARRLFRGVDAQGNTVYTDTPGDPLMAGPGEERFYGADGWRLDEGLTNPGRAADIVPGRGRAQGLRRAQTAFYDELDARNDQQLTAIGRRQPYADAQRARNEDFELASRVESMQRLGYSPDAIARATGQGQGMGIGDMIRLMQLQETRNQNQITNQRLSAAEQRLQESADNALLEQLTKAYDERPEATLRTELGMLRGLEGEQLRAALNTPRGRLLRTHLDQMLSAAERENRPFSFGLDRIATSPGGFGDLRRAPFVRSPFSTRYVFENDELIGGMISPSDLGMTPEQFRQMMQLYAEENARDDLGMIP